MWLLDTEKYRLHDYTTKKAPPYAILSHRWEEQEVPFRLMRDAGMIVEQEDEENTEIDYEHDLSESPLMVEQQRFYKNKLIAMKGWRKIINFCQIAHDRYGLGFAWIDTCCIDKSSSAELQEAINSMWSWYRDSHACIVYMKDVTVGSQTEEQFCKSEWFLRGWTLQELLAPIKVNLKFFDKSWATIGNGQFLSAWIHHATGIAGEDPTKRATVAQKMSWACKRKTTRPEDMAYCLIGLFGINMPLLYGEGAEGAFRRLQEEIFRSDIDSSILAWNNPHFKPHDQEYLRSHALAISPAWFQGCSSTRLTDESFIFSNRTPTPWGLQVRVYLREMKIDTLPLSVRENIRRRQRTLGPGYDLYELPLGCSNHPGKMLFACLLHISAAAPGDQYIRIEDCYERSLVGDDLRRSGKQETITIVESANVNRIMEKLQ